MTSEDTCFLKKIIASGVVEAPVLELGSGYDGPNSKSIIEDNKLIYFGTDVHHGRDVDYICDFEKESIHGKKFKTILIFNVLEHVFEPIKVLDNCLNCLDENGSLLIITPTVWQIHNYPNDFSRLLPDFYIRFADSRNLKINSDYFEFLGHGPIAKWTKSDGTILYPSPWQSKTKRILDKFIHKLFNTKGRGFVFPNYLAIGCLISK